MSYSYKGHALGQSASNSPRRDQAEAQAQADTRAAQATILSDETEFQTIQRRLSALYDQIGEALFSARNLADRSLGLESVNQCMDAAERPQPIGHVNVINESLDALLSRGSELAHQINRLERLG